MPSRSWSLRGVAPDYDGGVYLVAGDDQLTDQHRPISFAMHWTKGHWTVAQLPFVATSVATCPMREGAWIIGPHAFGAQWLNEEPSEFVIDPTDRGPQHYGDVTDISCIGGRPVAVGMSRTVYARDDDGWKRIDFGTRIDDESSDAGFTTTCGVSINNLYAFGWDGEIWQRLNDFWEQKNSPTNLILQQSILSSRGLIFACGQKGTIISGSMEEWAQLENHGIEENFWGITEFNEIIYICSTKSLYALKNNELEIININLGSISDDAPLTFYRLCADGPRLWSAGRRHLLVMEAGEAWRKIELP